LLSGAEVGEDREKIDIGGGRPKPGCLRNKIVNDSPALEAALIGAGEQKAATAGRSQDGFGDTGGAHCRHCRIEGIAALREHGGGGTAGLNMPGGDGALDAHNLRKTVRRMGCCSGG